MKFQLFIALLLGVSQSSPAAPVDSGPLNTLDPVTSATPACMANAPATIPPPCNQGSVSAPSPRPVGNIFRTCSNALGSSSNPTPAPSASNSPTLISQINAEWTRRIGNMYSGTQVDESGNTIKIETPTCSVTANQFDSFTKEITTNHLGQSCGNPVHISVSAGSSGISSVVNVSNTAGTLEMAYYRGLKAQIAAFELAQVKQEILNLNLKVSPGCQCAASYYQQLLQGPLTVNTVSTVQPYISALPNAALVWLCDPSVLGPSATNQVNLPEHVSQSMQQLCSVRANLEAMYSQLAVCEVQERTTHEFNNVISNPGAIIDDITADLTPQLFKQCASACNSCSDYGCCSSQSTSCVNRLYPNSLTNHFNKVAQPYLTPPTGGK